MKDLGNRFEIENYQKAYKDTWMPLSKYYSQQTASVLCVFF